jgi:hypothetical protein
MAKWMVSGNDQGLRKTRWHLERKGKTKAPLKDAAAGGM